MRHLFATIVLLVTASLASAGEAGRIVFVTGQAQLASQAVAMGDAVQEGDELSTGADGYIYMKTVDNGFLILRPGSRARVVTYHVDAQNPANTRIKFELLNGVARAISGQAVKHARHNFRFNTPVAAIGVRGTDFTVFTDQQTSRVNVISGGVVVSGFSGACGPEGAGPCEGTTSRELFAEQTGQILQIQKGQAAPQLLRNTALSPDVTVPPRKDEPASKAPLATPQHAANEPSLDAQKSDSLLTGTIRVPAPTPSPAPETPPVVVTPPPVVVPPVVVLPPPIVVPVEPKLPEIAWGRWEAVAGLVPDSEALAKIKSGDYESGFVIGPFVISRVKNSELVMPTAGQASFTLASSEAYIRNGTQAPVAATIQDSRFDVDFATRGFTTSLKVVSPDAQVDVRARGDVTLKGELYSSVIGSNAAIRGYIGGAEAKEAGYVFQTTTGSALTAFGATRWTK